MNITTADQLANFSGVKCTVYSRAGMGKTVLSATAPKPLVISAEKGTLSLKKTNLNRIFGENVEGITYDVPVAPINTYEELIEVHRWCSTNKDASLFETIIIDSITDVSEVILSSLKKDTKDIRQAYGSLMDQVLIALRAFRDLPNKNVVFIAQEEFNKDEQTGRKFYGPSFPGAKLSQKAPYITDEIFNLNLGVDENGNQFRYLLTQPSMQYDAKDRSGALSSMEPPNLGYIFNKIINS